MGSGASPFGFGFGGPLSADPDMIRKLVALGLPTGFSSAPGMGLPQQPDPGLGVQPSGFGAPADARAVPALRHPFDLGATAQTQTVPLPPSRPSDGELSPPRVAMQPPAFGFGGGPQAPQADVPATGSVPASAAGFSPPFKPLGAVGSASPLVPPAAGASLSFADKWKALADTGLGGSLMSLASGLLSAPGGLGWSAGFQAMQKNRQLDALTEQHRFDAALKLNKLSTEAGGRQSQVELLVANGYSRPQAEQFVSSAQAGNSTALDNALGRISPKAREDYWGSPGQTRFSGDSNQPMTTLPDRDKSNEMAGSIRKEIHGLPSYKNYSQALPVYSSMVETANRDSKASDLNLIYGLGKIYDPNSVVREGELQMAQDAQGVGDRLIGMYNGVMGGARLSPEARKQLLTEAFGRMQSYEGAFRQDRKGYEGIVGRQGLSPDDVLPNFEPVKPYQPPARAGASGATPGAAPRPGASKAPGDPQARFQQLLRSGMSKEQVYEKMDQEGY